jgi:hypothetical protein
MDCLDVSHGKIVLRQQALGVTGSQSGFMFIA